MNERLTDAYLIHYTSLAKFKALYYLPLPVRRVLKRALSNVAKKLLANLVRQDILMIEEEQAAFDQDPLRQPFEVNRAIRRVQQVIRRQTVNQTLD